MTKFISRFFIGCFTLLYAVFSIADIQILITDGSNTAKPIAVVPFSFNGNGSFDQNIEKIIASDLRNSGKFNPIDIRNMPQLPKTASEVAPKEWSTLGIDAVVIGDVKIDESMNYVIHYQLIDTVNNPGTILAENTYSVQNKWIRYAAHSASDEIFEKLSGIKGAFRTKIAYIVKMNSGNYPYELRISDYDGHEQVTIHRSKQPLMSPNWSPDGKKLVYVTFESGKSKLVMKTLETGALETIADYPQHNGAPSFSPDGNKLAFVLSKDGSLNIYVMDLVTKALKKITTGRSNNTEPSWMPDNRTLVYTSDQTGRPQIYSITIDGGVPQRITWDGTQNQNSRVSSDGHFMTMISTNNGIQNVTRFDFDSNNYQKLTNTFLDETPSISPNGIMIIYSSTQGLGSILNLVSTDGNFKAKLPATDGQVKFPAWSPYL